MTFQKGDILCYKFIDSDQVFTFLKYLSDKTCAVEFMDTELVDFPVYEQFLNTCEMNLEDLTLVCKRENREDLKNENYCTANGIGIG